jgi:hypothetical protein
MKSITERRFINGKKWTKAEREELALNVKYLKAKYKSASAFFWVLWRLKLCDREDKWKTPFGPTYYGDKLTQHVTYGKYDANQPERGSRVPDGNNKSDIPAWFREKDRLGSS